MVQYKKFKIGELFEKLSTTYYGKGEKSKAVSKLPSKTYPVNILYAKSGDNGIMYWAKEGEFETHENVIGIIYNGAIAAGLVYAQKDRVSVLAESYLIKTRDIDVPFATNLYLAKAIELVTFKKYSREYLATWGKVKEDFIELPVDTELKPDWKYMYNYIRDIESKYINKIYNYFERSGYHDLNDLKMNNKYLEIMDLYKKSKFENYPLTSLFDIYTGRDFIMMNTERGEIPVISRSRANNGFGIYSSPVPNQKLFDHKKTITATLIGQIWSTVHNTDFYIGTRVKALVTKDDRLNKKILQYISVTINKIGESYVTYQNKPADFEAISVPLPVKNNQLDFELMENYIDVIEKKVLFKLFSKMNSQYSFINSDAFNSAE